MERTVVFDLGGVLIDWNPRYLYRRLFDGDEVAMEHFLSTVCTPEWNALQDAGRPFWVATEELVERHPEHAELIRAFYGEWREMIGGPIAGTVELLAELRRRGTRLYALTNWGEAFPEVRREVDFLDWFEGIVVSGEEGVAKPDPMMFRILAERYQLTPALTTYIDDSPANVVQAARQGFDAIHFRSPEQLRLELAGRGLLDAERHPQA